MAILNESRKNIINQLKKEIILMQGFKTAPAEGAERLGLGPIESVFPNGIFPTGAIHEFLTVEQEQAAACGGFISCLLKSLLKKGNSCLWISTSRILFPPALTAFGISPDQIFFIDVKREKDVLWATEEALKCKGLSAVISEVSEMNLTQSRRIQLTAEKSGVTGFILRNDPERMNTTSCIARWRISPLASALEDDMPGLGFPRWTIELLKVRNGDPGQWQVEWSQGRFKVSSKNQHINNSEEVYNQQAG